MTEQELLAKSGALPNHHPIYLAAKALIDYMRDNSGAATGELIKALAHEVDKYDDLTIPDFLRRPLPDKMTGTEGLEDLLGHEQQS